MNKVIDCKAIAKNILDEVKLLEMIGEVRK